MPASLCLERSGRITEARRFVNVVSKPKASFVGKRMRPQNAQRRTKDGGQRDERRKRQTSKHRASQHDGFLPAFSVFGDSSRQASEGG